MKPALQSKRVALLFLSRLVMGFAEGGILPLGALYFSGSIWVLAAIFCFGWGLNGVFPRRAQAQ